MNSDQRDAIISLLEHIRKRPGMHFSDGLSPLDNFISGFDSALRVLFDQSQSDGIYNSLLEEEGLEVHKGLYKQLKNKGLSDEAIIDKTLHLIIETYRRFNA